MNTPQSSKKIIIYGGGMAGAILAKQLASVALVTLVDPNDYFEVPMAAPRSLVKPEFAEQSIIPFSKALPKAKYIRGKLSELENQYGLVTLEDGKQLKLIGDIIILATGSSFSNSLMRAFNSSRIERLNFYLNYSNHIKQAQRILIVGGGPIGVELAGEIIEKYADKSITIIEANSRILLGTTLDASNAAARELKKRGVTIITSEKIVDSNSSPDEIISKPGIAITSSNRRIPYDHIIWCVGGKPNTEYMKKYMSSVLNNKGQIKVKPTLQVVGCQNIFALGDITDLDENKMAWHINDQVRKAKHNIINILNNQSYKLISYKPKTGNPMMAVTIGSRHGVVYLPVIGLITCPLFTKAAKSGHMLVPKYRRALGL